VEHRYYPRKEISLEIDLFKSGQHIGRAFTKNISFGGMMLEDDQSALSLNENIMLRMWIEGALHKLSGFVIHTSQDHKGIMLIGMCNDTKRAYFNFLRDVADQQAVDKVSDGY
jgi:hypothetical protein